MNNGTFFSSDIPRVVYFTASSVVADEDIIFKSQKSVVYDRDHSNKKPVLVNYVQLLIRNFNSSPTIEI